MKKLIAVILTLACLFGLACGCGENKADNSSKADAENASSKVVEEAKAWLPCGMELLMTPEELTTVRNTDTITKTLKEDTINNGYESFDRLPDEELKTFYSVKFDVFASAVSYYFDKNKKLYSVKFTLFPDTEGQLEDLLNNIVKYYQNLTDTKPTFNEWSTPNVVGMNYEWNTSEIKIHINTYASNRGVYNLGIEITHPKYKVPEINVQ